MPKSNAEQLALIVVVTIGAVTAIVARVALDALKTAGPITVGLAILWAFAFVTIAALVSRGKLFAILALAAFVVSIVVLVTVLLRHPPYAPVALACGAGSALLVRTAIRYGCASRL